jgi:DNA-directed RNA polymerase specialized sigma24 family protein
MSGSVHSQGSGQPKDTVFPLTHWSGVLQAAGAEPDQARRAFEQLCADYRDAIAHWMRLQRLSPEDAEDAAHDFLAQWLQRENPLRNFQRGERRFREFLRVCLRRFLADWHARHGAARRGGGTEHVPLELDDCASGDADSNAHLDFAFASQIHSSALAKLKVEWRNKLRSEAFDRLCAVALGNEENPGYAALATELGATAGTVKSWMFRFRREYHEAFRDAVSRQSDPSLIDDDVLHLHKLLLHRPPDVTPVS